MSPDTVVLEVAFVEIPSDMLEKADHDDELWKVIDEQQLPLELRRQLQDNGFRVGVAGVSLSPLLTELLKRTQSGLQVDGDPGKIRSLHKRIQSRSGRRSTIVATNQPRDLVALVHDAGHLRGKTHPQGQCNFELRTYPQGDGRVQLQLVPEIEFGSPQTRYAGDHERGAWLVDSGRQTSSFSHLRIESMLSPGQSLVVGCTPQRKGMGRCFFVDDTSGHPVEKLLLIRLAQTQFDDLFAPDAIAPPLVTPAD